MAVETITCPKCHKTLRPAKPVAPGKTVKCPKCGKTFVVPDDEPEILAVTPATPPKKTNPNPPPPKKKSHNDDPDDDGPATYSFVQEPVKEEPRRARYEEDYDEDEDDDNEDDADKKLDISIVPDLSVKDLRGPAVETVIRPSNYLVLAAIIGCLTSLGLLIFYLIPIMFPTPIDEKDLEIKKAADAKLTKEQREQAQKKEEEDSPTQGMNTAGFVFLVVALYAVAFTYYGLITYGGVKMQTLESYRWGIVGSIMAMIPFGAAVPVLIKWAVTETEPEDLAWIPYGVNYFFTFLTGLWCLVTLKQKKVMDGFEYKAE